MRRLIRLARNILLFAITVIVILAGVLAFNTFTHGSRQLQVAAAPRAEVDAQASAKRLAEAIRFRTISSYEKPDQHAEALRGMRAHIEKSFPAFHAAAKREIVGRYSLLYTWAGSDPRAPPIAFLAHQDVVPVAPGTEKDWQQPPFDGVISDGFIWGRGAWDDKGNLYSMLEAAEAMAKAGFRPKRTIYFAFGHDEETAGTAGAKSIAALLASRGVRLDFVIDEGLLITEGIMKGLDRPAALIGVAEKGYATLVLNAQATPGHSSMPPRDTAIGMMSAALARLEDHRLPMQIRSTVAEMSDTLAPEMSGFNRVVLSNLWLFRPLLLREFEKSGPTEAMVRTTTALTIFNAGDKDNVLPGNAEATVNFRLIPGDTQESVNANTPARMTMTVIANSRMLRASRISRRMMLLSPRHCERSEAIHSTTSGRMDCFVAGAPLRKRFAFVAGNDGDCEVPLFLLRPLDAFQDQPVGVLGAAPAQHLHPFALFEILVVLEEVLDL